VKPTKKVLAICVLTIFPALFLMKAGAQSGGELRFCLHSEPKTFDPLKVRSPSAI
jgi:hypothetical protein